MKVKNLLIAATLGTTGLVAHLQDPTLAGAQSTTTGAIQGNVTDAKTGEKLAGVTVTVTSPALQGALTAITDGDGFYKLSPLPPGEYTVTFYYLEITLERGGVSVGVNRTTPVFQKLDQSQAGGEVVKIVDTPPAIDPTSTTQGITIDKNYMKNIPIPGRTFEAALGAAAGSQNDGLGVSFSGSSSLENQYYVDGVNTTGLTFGTVGSPVINDFIEEIEVITGGYNAEFGRATGGIVNVVTKSGSNEFKGSVFGYYQPGFLTAAAKTTPINASSIDATANNDYIADFGFEVGGPIIKDKLWFFAGFVPQFRKTDVTRITKRRTDCRRVQADGSLSGCTPDAADGAADVDPVTGFYITDELDREVRSQNVRVFNVLGKINYAATPENQGQLSMQLQPGHSKSPGVFGPAQNGSIVDSLTTDVSAKWTSKFNDNKTEVEAVIGWHRDFIENKGLDPSQSDKPLQLLTNGNLYTWGSGFRSETPTTLDGCKDAQLANMGDPYWQIDNCPMDSRGYVTGGPGSLVRDTEQRRAAKIGITHRVKAAGSHEFKAGIDGEDNVSDKTRLYSGGAFIQNSVRNRQAIVQRWVQLLGPVGSPGAMGNTDPRFENRCYTPGDGPMPDEYVCDWLDGKYGSPGTMITGNTFNWAAYVRDSWQIQPNLTLNVGLRYEEQRMRYSSELQDKIDPLTQVQLGKNAMNLRGMFAPRVGLLYDWTKEGRSKIYGHWGRFYESIPMDINDRSFGGETNYRQIFAFSQNTRCSTDGVDSAIGGPNGAPCLLKDRADAEELIGASGTLVAPGIKSQYMDEVIAGFEYELFDDLKIGVSYQNRRLGRIIEDVSTDGADTYIIANPGEWSADEEKKLMDRIERTDDMATRARLEKQLQLFRGIRTFDKPRRDYNALQFTVSRRFSKALYVQGSYTYSKTQGNYGGLYSADNGQVDPNISSQYDLIELLANRIGPLPQDRPHYIKLDGYYTFDLKKAGELTLGARIRALSGIPINALAGHYLYGANESFLLPRGQLGRTNFDHGVDLHVGYGRNLGKKMKFEVFFDIYNMYNRQGEAGVDDTYAPYFKLAGASGGGAQQNANPVSGGTYEDLIFVKTIDEEGRESGTPIGRNPNFRATTSRYAPAYGRIGVRLSF